LKDDWTKACPDSLSDFEKAKKCLSLQESVWGTEQLAKLEEVKEKADPEHLFQCFDCVGFKAGHGLIFDHDFCSVLYPYWA
jgi:hypothetical protein